MANQHYYLWVKSNCPFCVEAQKVLLENIKSHTVHIMDDELEELENVKKLHNHSTVPIIVLQEDDEETFIGGCSELKKRLNKGEKSD
jgi:glutaredoxin